MTKLFESLHLVKGLDPVADAFSGTVYSDIVSLQEYGEVGFLIVKGVGLTGTSTITLEASSNNAAGAVSAIPFHYRRIGNTSDTHNAWTAATSAGFTTTAGSSEMYLISITAEDLAASGYAWARLKAVESVDSPVLGGIVILMGQPARPLNHSASVI